MRIRMLRSLGQNMPTPTAEEGPAVKTGMDKDPPHLEGQVREMDDAAAHYLIRHGLAEETDEELTKLPVKAKATPAATPKTTPAPKTENKPHG